jgi:hypothetical protein
MSYILSAAGSTNPVLTLASGVTGDLDIPYLQDVTINNANDTFTWSQLDQSAKLQVATTATNSISGNIVVDPTTFFGDGTSTAGSAAALGLIGLSTEKTEVSFSINIGAKTVSGVGYVTGLAPAVSADSPVWVTPITISVSGEYTIA